LFVLTHLVTKSRVGLHARVGSPVAHCAHLGGSRATPAGAPLPPLSHAEPGAQTCRCASLCTWGTGPVHGRIGWTSLYARAISFSATIHSSGGRLVYRRHQPPKESSLTSSSGELPVPGAAAGLAGCARAKGPGRKLVLAASIALGCHDQAGGGGRRAAGPGSRSRLGAAGGGHLAGLGRC
jgi:hypothetical protein